MTAVTRGRRAVGAFALASATTLALAGAAPAAPPTSPLPVSLPASDAAAPPPSLTFGLAPERPVLVVKGARPRLVAHLHGNCHVVGYSAGRWARAAAAIGTLVAPTGNTVCGDAGVPATGPLWDAPVARIAQDLEDAVTGAAARTPLAREGALLTGYSRGAWLALLLARRAPGRWPGLVLVEGGAPLERPTAAALARAGVRAVALVAGDYGAQREPMRAAVAALEAEGVAARLVVVPKAGHPYADDMDTPMGEALRFVADVVDRPRDGG